MNRKECNQYKFVNTLDDLQTLQVHLFSDLGKVRKQIIVVKLSSAGNLFSVLEHQKSINTVSTVKALLTSSSTCFNEGTSLLSLIHTTKSRISTQQRNLWFFPNSTQTLRTAWICTVDCVRMCFQVTSARFSFFQESSIVITLEKLDFSQIKSIRREINKNRPVPIYRIAFPLVKAQLFHNNPSIVFLLFHKIFVAGKFGWNLGSGPPLRLNASHSFVQ